MKPKTMKILFFYMLLISFALGISGLIPLAGNEQNIAPANQKDALIGVFVTRESLDLFNMEACLNDHGHELFASGPENVVTLEDAAEYNHRIYATPIEAESVDADGEPHFRKEYIFEDLEGYLLCHAHISDNTGEYSTTIADDAFSDIYTSLNSTDEGEEVTLSAMIYSLPQEDGVCFFFNPVYQTAAGDVYLTAGTGSSVSGEALGSTSTHTLKDSLSFSGGEEVPKTNTATIIVSFQLIEKSEMLILNQMDANHEILHSQSYILGEMPDSITPLEDTAYLVLEDTYINSDGNTVSSYKIYDKDDPNLVTFIYKKDGVCVNKSTSIIWESEK
uniref:hypothetical protein n=1 Tax=Agathobacter sp. TaxID=2021311 RepID=UPI004056EF7F